MRPELFEKTYRLKDELSGIVANFNREITEEIVKRKWSTYKPEKKYSFSIAEDGSFNKKHYLGFYLYSVAGYAVGFKEDGSIVEETAGDIGISVIKRTDVVDSYLKMLMFLLELKALLRLAQREKPDVLILDGTLSSRFITFFPKSEWFTSEEFEGEIAKLSAEYEEFLKKDLMKYDITAFSDFLKLSLQEELKNRFGKKGEKRDVFEAAVSKVAYFEYLLLLHKLFYGLDWNPLIIGIAKTSHSTEIFNSSIPDIKIFYSYIKDTGYSVGTYVNVEEKKWEFYEVFDRDIQSQLQEVQLRYFYGKYDKGRHISLIEVYENPNRETPDFEEILDILSYYSVGGYPFLLKRADNEVRITNKDMEIIENLLDLKNEIHGRETLII